MRRITEYIIKFKWLVTIFLLGLTAWALYAIKSESRLETDLDEYMPADHAAFVYSDSAEALFDIKDAIVIAISNKEGIYNPTTLEKVKELTIELGEMEEVQEDDITSLYTADNILGSDFGLEVTNFYDSPPSTKTGLKSLKEDVRDNEMVYGRVVSKDESVTVIIAKIEDDVFTDKFYREIISITDNYKGNGDEVFVAGQPIVEGTMAKLMPQDMQKMVPIVLVIIVLVLLVVLRSFKTMLLTMLVVAISVIWTFGLMAGLGYAIYAPTTLIPVMLIAIGVADGIHMFSHMELKRKATPSISEKNLIVNMNMEMWKPVVMTSITTSAGFISLITSEVYPIKYFAVFAAVGVLSAMVLSLLFLPAGLGIIGLPKHSKLDETIEEQEVTIFQKVAGNFAEWIAKHRVITLSISVLTVLVFGYGINKVWINSSFLERFQENSEIRKTDAFVNEHFGGTTILNIILEADEKGVLKQPEVLQTAENMLRETDDSLQIVGETFGLNDFIKRMNKVMNENREEYNSIPDDNELIAQYLLLYEMSGDPEKLWEVVDQDFKKANLTIQLKSDNTKALNSALDITGKYKDEFEKYGVDLNYAGSGYKALVFNDLILEGQIKSLIFSLGLVILLLTIMFKNIKAGLIGAIPITLTTVISFGVLGWLNIPLETTTALISSIAIGIGIDYAVHFMDRYKINAKKYDRRRDVIRSTMAHSGRAILFNAAVVIAGFLVLLFSAFKPNQALGAIVSLNMFTSFLGTVTVMFLMIYTSKLFMKNHNKLKS